MVIRLMCKVLNFSSDDLPCYQTTPVSDFYLFVPTTSASSGPESSHNSLLTVAVGSSGIKSDFFLPRICNPSKLCVQESFWILWSAKAMSTTYDYYYYDTYGTSTTWISSSTEASVAGSECEFQLKEVGRK